MSYHSFVKTEDGQKIYHWENGNEYACDSCGEILSPELMQIHLAIDIQYRNVLGEEGQLPLNLDLHPGCLNQVGAFIHRNMLSSGA